MFRSLLRGWLKAPALVLLRVLNSPATLRDRGGWFGYSNESIMNLSKILILLLICIMGPVLGVEMSAEWHEEKEQSWQQARIQYPESASPGSFKTRMVEIDEWARVNDPALHLNSNKPLILARLVREEMDNRTGTGTQAGESRDLPDRQKVADQNAAGEGLQRSEEFLGKMRVPMLVMFILQPLLAVGGYFRNKRGIRKRALWGYLVAAVLFAMLFTADRNIYGQYLSDYEADLEMKMRLIAGLLFAFGVGKRARNAGYKWWLAGLSGVPLISLPMVIHLLFFKQRGSPVPVTGVLNHNQPGSSSVHLQSAGNNLPKESPEESRAELLITESTEPQSSSTMKIKEFEVVIPEGKELGDEYVELRHNTRYSLNLRNHRGVPCDAEVTIDGIHVGTWRIDASNEIRVERPVHDTGHFTFFEVGTLEARAAGIVKESVNGLVSVTFKPAKDYDDALYAAPLRDYKSGATGLTGESTQRFHDATAIDHDENRFFTIHLRLVSRHPDIRPLAPRSTPVPPPVD
jgi:hypothetical protein